MKHFLLVPAVALALIVLPTANASAQEADPAAELVQLTYDNRQMSGAYGRLALGLRSCRMPEQAAILDVQTRANDVSRRAGDLAWRLGGRQHVQALGVQSAAETTFWRASNMQLPDVCYQPSA